MLPNLKKRTVIGIRNQRIDEFTPDEVDYELPTAAHMHGSHINAIPMQNTTAAARHFYGARFFNQALPQVNREAPLVQSLVTDDPDGRSFDDMYGEAMGARRMLDDGEVIDVQPGHVTYKMADGQKRKVQLYDRLPFNRKSVSGDSVITIRRSTGFWRGRIADYVWANGDETPCVTLDGKPSWRRVSAYLKHACDKRMYLVTTYSGRQVAVTEDHSLVTLSDDFKLVPVEPLNAVVGLTRCPWSFAPDDSDPGTSADYDLGLIYGLYLAEGSLSKQRHCIHIAVKPSVRIEQVRALVEKTVGSKCHNTKKNISFTHNELYANLSKMCGRGAGNKFISADILQSSRKLREGVIAGYMSGDGCLHADGNGAIQLCGVSTSKRLRDDLVFLLGSLGIPATKWDAPRNHINKKWTDAFGFRVVTFAIPKLKNWFFYDDRRVKLSKLLHKKTRASSFEHIPIYGSDMRRNLRQAMPGPVGHYIYKTSCNGAVSKRRLKMASGQVGKWANSEVLWDTIVSILPTKPERWVYDLEVEEAENFMVDDGLIVHNSHIHNEALVKVGDKLKKGALVASSNYTDKTGTMAMGTNARVGIVPYKGWSMDDAIVISDSYAKRMAAEQVLTHHQEFDDQTKGGLKHFTGLFPTAYTKDQLANFDPHGVVKPGTILKQGDPMILATAPKTVTSADIKVGKLSRVLQTLRRNASQTWDLQDDGEVTDVAHGRHGIKVIVRTVGPARVGDKLAMRSGAKAEISLIMPDDQMPRTMDGKPLEVLLNPLSISSRVNNGLPYEIMLGKVARKLGKALKVPSFQDPSKSQLERVKEMLAANGLTDKEEVFDPVSNRKLEHPITVGDAHVLRLWHLGEGKQSHRGVASYSSDEQPLRGSSEGGKSKRSSGLEINAMLAAGAYANLQERSTLLGAKNDEYWRAVRSAHTPRTPGRPFVFNKFLALLEGAGLKARDTGRGKLRLGPMTDAHVDSLKPAEIRNGETVKMTDLSAIEGGLFDPSLVGGSGGSGGGKYGKVTLPHAMPNPSQENSIRILLKLTKREYEDVLAGRMDLPLQR